MNNKVSLPPISDILNNSQFDHKYLNNYNLPLPTTNSYFQSNPSFYKVNNKNPLQPIPSIGYKNYIHNTKELLHSNYDYDNRRSSSTSSTSLISSSNSNSPKFSSPSIVHSNINDHTNNKKIELPNNITANTVSTNEKRKTRNNLPKETTYILLKWLNDHLNHPYPNNFEKNQLMLSTGLNQQQLSNWFINARRRKIKILKGQGSIGLK